MTTLFINGSPNKNGNTVVLAQKLLANQEYETLHLVDYKIYDYGQDFSDDQFEEVIQKVFAADTLVIGSPVYWHSINGLVRNFLDRQYDVVKDELVGKKLYFIFQGSAPTQGVLDMGDYTMSRYAGLYGMDYQGMVNS
ncbi:flavodoxin family protein [Streptococcus suis]|uniref:flavodoxin family protein n=1 Tax=Streptococcus suis TaxID=1307 RepID=UPI00209BB083|nr:NAD(P)H-dependent oxidoreductase [Streptococcus suis]MCO8189700.1 NAD(P)H-dependent oxidoreductase [Streptococcus suis]MCO8200483.1 NAD(P)H-dependent oxidoreductase [Streptococcus suis]MCO8218020.1 NAD(P)H-dependent oxidoreductase [Streptococcus suis]MCO8231451.1 NAD(P)H-dependent oxidoreductase [Streptococcus suis]MCO8233472.1 NAD(P)H-dependent oxidoreductase [Streptococcus suis]